MMKFKTDVLFFATAAIFCSCAVDVETPSNEDDRMYLEAWIHTHYPDAEQTGLGVFILDDNPAEGEESVQVPCYARVTYTIRDLEGNVSSTGDSTVAKQLGTFNRSYYYGPRVWNVYENAISRGVEDMITGMTVGSTRTAVIPGWLQTYNRLDSKEEYMAAVTGNSPQIYEVRIDEVTDDIIKWQIDSLESYYLSRYLEKADSTYYGFYYKSESGEAKDEEIRLLHKDTTIYVNYTGRLLNGQVFDTTLKDTAKVHGIYDSSKTYEPMEVSMDADSTQIQLDGNSTISGFGLTLWQMEPMGKGSGMFYSGLGYGSSGSGSRIPEFAPLVFEIEIVADPEEEEE